MWNWIQYVISRYSWTNCSLEIFFPGKFSPFLSVQIIDPEIMILLTYSVLWLFKYLMKTWFSLWTVCVCFSQNHVLDYFTFLICYPQWVTSHLSSRVFFTSIMLYDLLFINGVSWKISDSNSKQLYSHTDPLVGVRIWEHKWRTAILKQSCKQKSIDQIFMDKQTKQGGWVRRKENWTEKTFQNL